MTYTNHTSQKAWVVFSGQTELPWLRFLKPGFRHCYVVLHDGERWISVDPLSHFTEVAVHHHVPADFDLPNWLRGRGLKVIRAPDNHAPRKTAPFMPFTCVEAVKRIIGIHQRFIFTPWQLYSHLTTPSYATQGELSWAV
jgi:hypothetical protein